MKKSRHVKKTKMIYDHLAQSKKNSKEIDLIDLYRNTQSIEGGKWLFWYFLGWWGIQIKTEV